MMSFDFSGARDGARLSSTIQSPLYLEASKTSFFLVEASQSWSRSGVTECKCAFSNHSGKNLRAASAS